MQIGSGRGPGRPRGTPWAPAPAPLAPAPGAPGIPGAPPQLAARKAS
ncbi:hypothetical protein GCM10010275_07140 [Streptomyces litmocidini]|nr:hypothetical protein GCM10010275_07140 [Streptomyces litmocidini]